ncbi:MAG: hypothetical protein JST20_11250 [Bacteroidetes bacterium]|nr:hypothetical protein [Bacteroidota bacterium]
MNTRNHLLLDEYLAGKLKSAEKKKFLDQLETDDSLLRLVEAERIIKQSIISDKEELEKVDHSSTYAFLLAGLAASAAVAATSTTAVAASKSVSGYAAAKSVGSTIINIPGKIGIWTLASSVIASAVIGVASYKLSTSDPQNHQKVTKTTIQKHISSKDSIAVAQQIPSGTEQDVPKRKRNLRYEDMFHDIYGNVIEPKQEPTEAQPPNK